VQGRETDTLRSKGSSLAQGPSDLYVTYPRSSCMNLVFTSSDRVQYLLLTCQSANRVISSVAGIWALTLPGAARTASFLDSSNAIVSFSGSPTTTQRSAATPLNARQPDTTLTPPRAQYGATQGKPGKRNPLRYAGVAIPCNPLQRVNYHS
jgi:hypothetical protein